MFVRFRLRRLRKKAIQLYDDAYAGAYFDVCDLLCNVIDALDGVGSEVSDVRSEEDEVKEG